MNPLTYERMHQAYVYMGVMRRNCDRISYWESLFKPEDLAAYKAERAMRAKEFRNKKKGRK